MKKLLVNLFFTVFILFAFSLFAQNVNILEFDGDDYIRYADDSETQLDLMDGAADFTIEAWIYINTWEDYNRILQRYSCWRLYLNTSNRISFGIYSGSWFYYHSTNNAVNTGEWAHIAVIRDTAGDPNTIKLYVNGTDVTSGTPSGYTLRDLSSANLYVGQDGSGSNFLADGYVDEVRLKNVAEDISDLQTVVDDVPYTADANTAVLFNFDEGTGFWTNNLAGGNDGRLGGTAEGDGQEPTWRTWDYPEGDLPLPVVLSSFTAEYSANNLSVYWITQSETNNSGWNVYRSDTENSDEAVQVNTTMIEGAGTTTSPTEYSFLDDFIHTYGNTYYYWIESVDQAGTTYLYNPVGIDIPFEYDEENAPDILEISGIQNYPNPFNPSTVLAYKTEDITNANITIFNTKGQIIRTFNNLTIDEDNNGYEVWNGKDSSGMPVASGIYFYRLTTKTQTYSKKMILSK